MIHLRSYSNFLNESKIDIASEVDREIEILISDMVKNKECEQVDTGYLEIETPFVKDDEKAPKTKVEITRRHALRMRMNLFFIYKPRKC
jgi:hypothetical protein